LFAGGQAKADEQMGLAGAGSESERLQQIRAVLPCEVRVTAATHPLFGSLLAAHRFRRVDGEVFLVVTLPDGSPGTIRVEATDIVAAASPERAVTVLDGDGVRRLHQLVDGLRPSRGGRVVGGDDK
jgi:hypothetical protein